jgi:predicted nucleic acid-binding protein
VGSIKAVFDTNILIDYLRGVPQAKIELDRYLDKAISVITWMEIMVGTTESNRDETRLALLDFLCLPITMDVAERAAAIRSKRNVKLPDAIIQATAEVGGRLLVTRNVRDFSAEDPGVRIPYKL